MAQVDPIPPEDELKKRRQPKFIIDPRQITQKDHNRVRAWAAEIMSKNEHKLNNKFKDREIVTSGEVEAEAIDIRSIYPFQELNWYIFRDGPRWSLMLRSHHRILFTASYAKI